MNNTVFLATMDKTKRVDAQVHPVELNIEQYGVVLATMIRACINMFVSAGLDPKEATDKILKTIVKETRNPSQNASFFSSGEIH